MVVNGMVLAHREYCNGLMGKLMTTRVFQLLRTI